MLLRQSWYKMVGCIEKMICQLLLNIIKIDNLTEKFGDLSAIIQYYENGQHINYELHRDGAEIHYDKKGKIIF